jgi:hypothetical protein
VLVSTAAAIVTVRRKGSYQIREKRVKIIMKILLKVLEVMEVTAGHCHSKLKSSGLDTTYIYWQ